MPVQIPGTLSTHKITPDSVSKKSKKRKHETPEKEPSSSKKRKHADEAKPAPPEVLERSGKRKKKKLKRTEPSADTIRNSIHIEEDANLQDLRVNGAKSKPERDTERKKKKKKKPKAEAEIAVEDATANVAGINSDNELPDAPALNDSEVAVEEEPEVTPETDPIVEASESNTDYLYDTGFLDSAEPSSFYSTRLSLHLSIPAIALSTASKSILSTHLAPLLLTYFPPAKGIVLAFSDPVLSARPDFGVYLPLRSPVDGTTPDPIPAEILSRTADEFGACWVWLTVTILVFRPEKGDKMYGWTNVTSEGFIGVVGYNFFQVSVGKLRIPSMWTWNGPTREPKKRGRKGRLRDEDGYLDSQGSTVVEDDAEEVSNPAARLSDGAGFFFDEHGNKVPEVFEVKIVDIDMVPEKDRWALNIDGSLLNEEAEQKVVEEERLKFERIQKRGKSATSGSDLEMSGGLAESRASSMAVDSPE